LDPKFEKAYWFGAAFVSIFRRDEIGAKELLTNWVRQRPTFWRSHYNLGFHLFHEMHLYDPAAFHILRAASLPGAPSWLTALGVRLLTASAGTFSALQAAVGLYDSVNGTEGRYRLRMRVRSLAYALQKARWKEALERYKLRNG